MPCVCTYHLGLQVIASEEVYPWHTENSSDALELLQEERGTVALKLIEKTCGDLGSLSQLVSHQRACPSHLSYPAS